MEDNEIKKFNEELRKRHLTIICAESITAGLLASTIANVSGASDVLKGSIVTYSRELKTSILGVDPRIIDEHSAESAETTAEMAYGLTRIYPGAGIYVAVTGVASKPANANYKIKRDVGQIYVAIYYKNKMYATETSFGERPRSEIRELTVEFIFAEIVKIISS